MWYNGTGKKLHNLPHSSWLCKDLFHCLSFFQVIRYTFPFTLFSSLASQLLQHWFKTSTSSDNLDYSLDIKTLSQVGQNKGKCQLHLPSNRSWVTIASHAGVFRGARFSSLPTYACSTEDNIPFPSLANHNVLSKFWKVDLDRKVIW